MKHYKYNYHMTYKPKIHKNNLVELSHVICDKYQLQMNEKNSEKRRKEIM